MKANRQNLAAEKDDAIEAAISLLRERGMSAVSFRLIGERAGIHPATLQSRHGTKHALLDRVFALLADQEIRYARHVGELATGAKTHGEGAKLFGHVICGGGGEREPARDLALVEMLIAAARDPTIRPHAGRWLHQMQRCWAAAFAAEPGSPDLGWFLTELQVGLMAASIGCGRPLETAMANGEIVARALDIELPDGHTWFSTFLEQARRNRPRGTTGQRTDSQSERLLTAGAEIVAIYGADALSFRSVANRAGLGLSAVTNAFPKRQDLINAIYDRIFEGVAYAAPLDRSFRDVDAAAEYFVEVMLKRRFAGANLLLALAELYVAAARHPSLRDLAWFVRMTRGNVHREGNAAPDQLSPRAFDSHAMALWLPGCFLTHASCTVESRLASVLETRVRFGLGRLAPRGAWPARLGSDGGSRSRAGGGRPKTGTASGRRS